MARPPRKIRAWAAAALLVALSGCGGGTTTAQRTTPSQPNTPVSGLARAVQEARGAVAAGSADAQRAAGATP